jgi:hypothetical protein
MMCAMPSESRSRKRWAGAIVAVAGLLIALGAWLLPDPGQRLCGLSGDRFSGCSDIPSAYIGRWTGTLTAVDYGILYSPTKKEFPSTLTIQRARIDKGVAAHEQGDESSCAQEWRLTAVRDDSLSFHVDHTYPLDPAGLTQGETMRRCTPDLSVMVKLVGADSLQVEITSGPATSPLILPAGLRIAHGTLRRV